MAINCSAVPEPIFQPAMRLISAITQADPAVVTTTFDHQYIDGGIVRLIIPKVYGMVEANDLTGTVTVLTDTTFEISIDSSLFQPFVDPADPGPHENVCAHVLPVGEINSSLASAIKNVLPYPLP